MMPDIGGLERAGNPGFVNCPGAPWEHMHYIGAPILVGCSSVDALSFMSQRRDGFGARHRLIRPHRIPDSLPQMPIRILEVSGITTPKSVVGWLDDDRPGNNCLGHDGIDFGL
jgi:hypothetical protein